MTNFKITREIGIDAGHRVPDHGSKCRNLHGHRYTIQATCEGELAESGEEKGMVMDFGFLKEEMMNEIDKYCDHGMILYMNDPWVPFLVDGYKMSGLEWHDRCLEQGSFPINQLGNALNRVPGCKFYLVPFIPTAENLARHWYERLSPCIKNRSGSRAKLTNIRVFETPNCWSDYPGQK